MASAVDSVELFVADFSAGIQFSVITPTVLRTGFRVTLRWTTVSSVSVRDDLAKGLCEILRQTRIQQESRAPLSPRPLTRVAAASEPGAGESGSP